MRDYTTKATVELDVNGQKAKAELEQQRQLVKDLEVAYAKAEASGDKSAKTIQKELNKARRELKSMQSATTSAADVLRRLDKATPKELKNALRQLNKELNSIPRGTKAWDEHVQKIRAVKKELENVNASLATQKTRWEKLTDFINKWQTMAVAAFAVVLKVVSSAKSAVNAYAEMDAEMANVRKYTGMTAEQVEVLNEEFKKMDTRTSREELNQLAQEAGRLGKTSQEDILGFVRAADKINVALDDLGDGATLTISKLTGIFGDEERLGTEHSLLAVGSVINELSQNCSASAPYLAEFASRMGGVGAQANLTIPQLMAYGAVLDSNNQAVEASATAVSQVIVRMMQDPAKYAKVAGIEVEKFSNLLKTDVNGALILFLETLNQAGGMDVLSPMFAEMGENGARAISALSTLANRIEDVKTRQQEATIAFAEATSVDKEFNVQNNTVQAGLDKAKKSIAELKVELGEQLMPITRYMISSTSAMIRVLSTIANFVKDNIGVIAVLTATVLAYSVAVNVAVIKVKLLALWQGIVKTAMVAWHAVSLLCISTTALLTGHVTRATAAFKLLSATLKLSPIGLLVGSITAIVAGLALWITKTSQLTAKQKALNEIEKEAHNSASRQLTDLRILYEQTQNQNIALEERRKAVEKLQQQYPDYFGNLSTEAILAGNAANEYDRLATSILNTARAEARRNKISSLENEIVALETEYKEEYDRLYNTLFANGVIFDTGELGSDGAGRFAPEYLKFKTLKGVYADPVKEKRQLQKELSEDVATLESDNSKNAPKTEKSPKYGNGGDTTNDDRFKAEKEWREREEALNRIAYSKGEKSYLDYTKRMNEIEVEFYNKQLAHTDLSENERLSIKAQYYEAVKKQNDANTTLTLDAEKQSYNERLAEAKQFYIDGQYTLETYNEATARIEEEHLRNMVALTKEGTKERIDAEKALADYQYQAAIKKQQETKKKEEESKRAQDKLKDDYFGLNESERKAAYARDIANLDIVYKAELAAAGNNAEERLRIEEAYQKARLALQQKYGLISVDDNRNSLERANAELAEWLKSDAGKAVTQSYDTVMSGMSSIFSQMSSIVQAELEMQTASIEKRYDKEISLAEGNSYKVAKLEKQKEKEIAKAKNEANKKMFAMQVIQAVAQTAQNALNAYGSAAAIPLVGYIIAPIAAAMAIAAGALQIAAIKKQQQASASQGYSEGGYTRPGAVDEPAGIVHAGEWVASQRLLANPQARAMIDTLDYAQRTNTIGSLRSADVSRSIRANDSIARLAEGDTGTALLTAAVAQMSRTASDLNDRLSEPFVTVNTVTGDLGIKRAQDAYAKLINNKSPKLRKTKI